MKLVQLMKKLSEVWWVVEMVTLMVTDLGRGLEGLVEITMGWMSRWLRRSWAALLARLLGCEMDSTMAPYSGLD